jgi:hypothetical protein
MLLPARTFHAGPVSDRLLTRLRTLGLNLQAGQAIGDDAAELLILCLPACLEELADHRLRAAQALEMDPASAPARPDLQPDTQPANVIPLGRHYDGR